MLIDRLERYQLIILVWVWSWVWSFLSAAALVNGEGGAAAACFCLAQLAPYVFEPEWHGKEGSRC